MLSGHEDDRVYKVLELMYDFGQEHINSWSNRMKTTEMVFVVIAHLKAF